MGWDETGPGRELPLAGWDREVMGWDRTGPGRELPLVRWDQKFFRGMGWDQISVGWELPVSCQARTGTGTGQGLGGMGAPSWSHGQPNCKYNNLS